jgi:hypothetical protein
MHGHGIAGALRNGGLRAAMALLAPICISLGASQARAAVYSYTGDLLAPFAPFPFLCPPGDAPSSCVLFQPGDLVTGQVVLSNPLPPSVAGFSPDPQSFTFSFTDGVDTITNATIAQSSANTSNFSFTTDANGAITQGTVGLFAESSTGSGNSSALITAGGIGGDAAEYVKLSASGSCCIGAEETSSLQGTWTGPSTEPPPPPPPQVVYLDFGQDHNAVFQDPIISPTPITYSKPQSTFLAQQDHITQLVQQIFSPYLINFTDAKPPSGEYETIYIGGTPSNISAAIAAALTTPNGVVNGDASEINLGDHDHKATAVVFSEDPFYSGLTSFNCAGGLFCNPDPNVRLAQTIAHEAGHILGLVHVTDSSQLLYPDGTKSPEVIGGPAIISQQTNPTLSNPNVISEDSNAILSCNLGLVATQATECTTIPEKGVYYSFGNVTLNVGLQGTHSIFDATLFDIPAISDGPESPAIAYLLGTLLPGINETIDFPAMEGDTLFVQGSLSEGGPLFDFGGIYNPNAQTFVVTNNSIINTPEPGSALIIGVGTFGLLWKRVWRGQRKNT